MVAIDFRSWKITLNPVEHHSEPDGAALSLLRSKEATWRFALDVRVQANDLECRIPAVERARSEGRGGRVQFIPYRFEFSNKLTKQHKLMLAFDAFVPSDAIGRDIRLGMLCPIFHRFRRCSPICLKYCDVSHIGPAPRGDKISAPHALAALAALGQPTRLEVFRLLMRKEPEGFRRAQSRTLS